MPSSASVQVRRGAPIGTALLNRRVISWLARLDPITRALVGANLAGHLKCPVDEVILEPEWLDNAACRWLHSTYHLG